MIGVDTSALPPRRRIPGSPLAVQIAVLMLGGLIVAQLVTLFLTLMLPPEPQPEYRLGDIAAALRGSTVHPRGGRPLVRTLQERPPGLQGPGWLVSQQSQHELARMLGTADGDVRLLFYTPLPFAGAATQAPRQRSAMADAPLRLAQVADPSMLVPPTFPTSRPPPPAGVTRPPPDITQPGRAMPGFRVPPADGSARPLSPFARAGRDMRDAARGGGMPPISALPPGAVVLQGELPLGPGTRTARGTSLTPSEATQALAADAASNTFRGQALNGAPAQSGATGAAATGFNPNFIPGDAGRGLSPGAIGSALAFPRIPTVEAPRVPATVTTVETAPAPEHRVVAAPLAAPEIARAAPEAPPAAAPVATASASAETAPAARAPELQAAPLDGPAPAPARGLFGLAPVPFVQGDFVAAMKVDATHWAVVQPEPEPFPNSWQRRVLLWFALSFALVAPLSLMFARRLVKPLEGFADAAEQLGRDPRAPVMTLAGPAEIGRAARAFNQMQGRLRRFVDDRTAMIGAISHDLRTPLTRMRFRLEEAPDHVREGMLEEVAQMEEMITSVLHFIRDASEPGSRETMDMRSILASVVDGANLTGGDVRLEPGESAWVDVDALGMKRVLSNLVDNALKYGDAARIRLFRDGGDAVAEVIDEGPGLPDEELERVFQPFYRSPATRPAETAGMGLGLAACRSITRAHGGEVTLKRGGDGLVAEVRLPLAVA